MIFILLYLRLDFFSFTTKRYIVIILSYMHRGLLSCQEFHNQRTLINPALCTEVSQRKLYLELELCATTLCGERRYPLNRTQD